MLEFKSKPKLLVFFCKFQIPSTCNGLLARKWQNNKHLYRVSSDKATEQFSLAAEKGCFTQNKIIQLGHVQYTRLNEQTCYSPSVDLMMSAIQTPINFEHIHLFAEDSFAN